MKVGDRNLGTTSLRNMIGDMDKVGDKDKLGINKGKIDSKGSKFGRWIAKFIPGKQATMNRATVQSFRAQVEQNMRTKRGMNSVKLPDHVAKTLKDLETSGKPLTGRVAKQVLHDCAYATVVKNHMNESARGKSKTAMAEAAKMTNRGMLTPDVSTLSSVKLKEVPTDLTAGQRNRMLPSEE